MDPVSRKQELLGAVASAAAYREIQNTIGRAVTAFMYHQSDKIEELFCKDETVRLAFPGEEQQGRSAVSAMIGRIAGSPLQPGEMTDCHLCSPQITLSPDLRTARGEWKVISAIGKPTPDGPEAAKAMWGMGVLTAEFTDDEGRWLITALRYERQVLCDYDLGWAKEARA